MAKLVSHGFTLYRSQTGQVANIRAQAINAAGALIGAEGAAGTGYTELGGGSYFYTGNVDDTAVAVRHRLPGSPDTVVTVALAQVLAIDAGGRVTVGSVGTDAIGPASISTAGLAAIAGAVWGFGSRTLTGFGTLVSDVATAVWSATTRTLTGFGFTVNTNANATDTAIKTVTDRVAALLENVAGVDRYKASALSQAPVGEGGGGGGGGPVIPGYTRFEFTLTSARQQLSVATRPVAVRVLAYRGSVPVYALDYPASMAVLPPTQTPTDADFKPAAWDEDGCASVLVGPLGDIAAPAAGSVAYVYIRLDNAPETAIERVASVAFL